MAEQNYSTEEDLARLQADQQTWGRAITGGLLDIAKVAVGNLTNKQETAVSQTVKPESSSFLANLDTKKIVLIGVALIAVVFIGKKLLK